jgi:hypothetical protein
MPWKSVSILWPAIVAALQPLDLPTLLQRWPRRLAAPCQHVRDSSGGEHAPRAVTAPPDAQRWWLKLISSAIPRE